MLGLKELQARFQAHLLAGDAGIRDVIAESDRLSRDRRLMVYAHAYRARLRDALAVDYKALHALLGEDAFDALCQTYIDAHPSRSYTLRDFGGACARHLGHDAAAGRHDWRAEMARLEWALVAAFDAADVTPATAADAAAVAPEAWPALALEFHPAVQLIDLWWNTLPCWRAARHGEPAPAPARLPQRLACLVWREGLETRYRSLEPPEDDVLRAALAGETFAQLCGRLADATADPEQVPLHAAGLLKTWLNAGLISGLRV
jgi:hypothetical protein